MNHDKSQFDFMDMIYQPIVDAHVRMRKYDYVFCDESQDFSKAQQEIIRKSLNRRGRLITVGDENQAIYGFCGSDADSYEQLSALNGESVKMPLSVCYRCSKAVVNEAQKIVPEISYAMDAEDGYVKYGSLRESLTQGDWILCRNLKPLIQTYLWLMKNKVKSKIKGKDIGEGILGMINKTGARTLSGMWKMLEIYKEKLYMKLKKRGVRKPSMHPKMELFQQRLEVIECLMNEVGTVDELKKLIDNIFTDEVKGIMLSTIHKSKGLENDRIFLICPELLPSRYATTDWMLQQERNLLYVAITRAKRELIYVSESDFKQDIKSNISI
jgi:superfamily I DNA/RNA helicase